MVANAASSRRPLAFFVLTFVLAVPFWILGTVVARPGGVPLDLPWSALVVVCPVTAALILVRREEGRRGVRELLRRVVDPRGIGRPAWYLPVIGFMPAVVALSGLAMSALGRQPSGSFSPFVALPVLFAVFFVSATAEELGWTGYATDPLRARWGTASAALWLGVVWSLFHLIPWIQVHGLVWSAGYALFTIAARVVIVWLYYRTGGSLLAAILFHAMINTSAALSPYTGAALTPYLWAALTVVAAWLWRDRMRRRGGPHGPTGTANVSVSKQDRR